ncbi:competence protein CoiA family protein [Streptomyces sp. NPDC005132]|uniref:competence protein CoiA n=1 Tax=Streptomyces sp. NPDC005132 TaxID=3154294 RepID=UPI0033ADE760
MPFTAQHAEYGRLDATRPDLGCGVGWDAIHLIRAPLHCRACEGRMVARVSVLGLRHFAHWRRSPDCPLAGESPGHLLLKSELASAARAAGWSALLEDAAPDGRWRADVLAISPDGRRLALEAQLSAITEREACERTTRYTADGVEVCWFDDRDHPRPWMNAVPSLHLTNRSGATRSVRGIIARYEAQSGWQAVADVTLTDAVTWILGRRLVPYADGYVHGWDEAHPSGYSGMLWTAPLYAAAALEETQRRRAQENAEEAHWDAMEASKKVKAAAYDRFWARTGIGPGW